MATNPQPPSSVDQDTQHYQVQLPMFEGPLDLLLHLIEREELDITKVALGQVTDQYLGYLSVLKEVEVEFLTDFLVIAAKLVYIKSQALLPKPPPSLIDEEEEDIGDQLAQQLRLYKQFKMVAQTLRERETDGLRNFIRLALPPKFEPKLIAGDVTIDDLAAALKQALAIKPVDSAVGEVVSPITVTIGEQMALIKNQLDRDTRISFQNLLRRSSGRLEVIVTFLAVLELIKQYVIEVRQYKPFGDILISPSQAIPQGELTDATEGEDNTHSLPAG